MGESLYEHDHKTPVDLLNDLHQPGELGAKEVNRPFLQSFGQNSVIRVCEGFGDDVPGRIPSHAFFVHQQPHELGYGNHRVGVVELYCGHFMQPGEVCSLHFLVFPNDVLEGCGAEEVLLAETQGLAGGAAVVGIEHTGQITRSVLGFNGPDVVHVVEELEVEPVVRFGFPQTKRSDGIRVPSDDGHVVGYGLDIFGVHRLEAMRAIRLFFAHHMAAEAHHRRAVASAYRPRIAFGHPIVRTLHLPAVHNFLSEHTVLIADAVTPGRKIQAGEGLDEAGRQTAQSAVTQSGVWFGLLRRIQIQAHVLEHFGNISPESQVDHVVSQGASHQELRRKVVGPFQAAALDILFAVPPFVPYQVHQGSGNSFVSLAVGGSFGSVAGTPVYPIGNAFFEFFFVKVHGLLLLNINRTTIRYARR
jgi:hypothetical protein